MARRQGESRLQSKEKVSGEMAIVFTAYNLRRAMSILGVKPLIEALKKAKPSFSATSRAKRAVAVGNFNPLMSRAQGFRLIHAVGDGAGA